MLIGEYHHNIDPKKRIALPAKFRRELGNQMVITKGLDNCLFLYPLKQWEKISEKLSEMPIGQADTRGFNRFMLAGAIEADLDSMGRILLPDYLRNFAGLKNKVVIAGVYNRLEIWDESKWDKYKMKIEKKADDLAEKLGEVGLV
ncbi:MAG TPA: transcriptional regulator MraZ [Candidatus Atribacteria bacterium]|nr:transcriptional regulator MraZ [Candidatus Atribacteria bacterium]